MHICIYTHTYIFAHNRYIYICVFNASNIETYISVENRLTTCNKQIANLLVTVALFFASDIYSYLHIL